MGFLFNRARKRETTNPYTKKGIASSITDDRYMNLATSKRNWQIAFFIAMGVIVLQDIQLGRVAVHSKVEPWLVELNNGQVVNAQRGTALDSSDKAKLVKIFLQNYILDARTVLNDEVAEKKLMDKVYSKTTDKAYSYLNEYYAANDPFEIAANYTVSPDIVNTLPLSDSMYQITWDEHKRSVVDGAVLGQERYVAQLTFKQSDPTPAQAASNPFGLWVTSITWSKSQ